MANYKLKIEGTNFINSFLKDFQGKTSTKKCLCIPAEDNNIFITKDGKRAYIELVAWEDKPENAKEWRTHGLQISFPKEKRDAMSEEEKKKTYVGSMDIIGKSASAPSNESAPYPTPTPDAGFATGTDGQPDGDLPF